MRILMERYPRLMTGASRWLLVVLALNMTGAGALGQGSGAPIPKSYLNKGTVHLPIQIDERERSRIQEVQLYVKENPQTPWVLKEKVPPTQTFFTFRTPQDGEYWFSVATLDRAGKMLPANVNQEPPGLIVVIDSLAPQIEVSLAGTVPEGQQVRCEVKDANPEPSKTRVFFQTRDQMWRSLDPVNGQPDTFTVPGQAALTGMIRVTAYDLAGNSATREFNLTAMAAASTAPASAFKSTNVNVLESIPEKIFVAPAAPDQVGAGPKMPVHSTVISETIIPSTDRVEIIANKTNLPEAPVSVAVETPRNPFAQPSGPDIRPEKTAVPTAPRGQIEVPAKRHLVNHTHVFLDYQIEQTGASGVGRVEVWYTRDMSQTWQKLGEDSNRKGQAEVDLPGEGVYGVTIVVANGRGFGANPPEAGDTPDWWIEVDTTKPKAELLNVRSNANGDDGSLHITWTAKDKNLHAEPVDLYYAVNRTGPWLPIIKGLKNDGLYRWMPAPQVGSHAFIRLTVRDQAGNNASSDSIQPVVLDDLSRPRGRVVGVTTAPRSLPQLGTSPVQLPLPPQGN